MAAGFLVRGLSPFGVGGVNTTLAPRVSVAQGLFVEAILTIELVFVVLMLAGEKGKHTFLAPIGVGMALLVAEIPGKFTELCMFLTT